MQAPLRVPCDGQLNSRPTDGVSSVMSVVVEKHLRKYAGSCKNEPIMVSLQEQQVERS